MINYAEFYNIDLEKLEAERFYHYPKRNVATRDADPYPSLDNWEGIATAANMVNYHVDTLRCGVTWVKFGL